MSDERAMIDSEAVTAGAIRQSVDRAIEKSTCPLCGADYVMDTPYRVQFACGTFMSPLRKRFIPERGDVESEACLRRQLEQANERYAKVVDACRDAFDPIAEEIDLFPGDNMTLVAPQKAAERIKELRRQLAEARSWRPLRRQLAQVQVRMKLAHFREVRLRRVLAAIEWSGFDPNENGDACPWCGWYKRDGHAPDCELAAALANAPANPYAAVMEAAIEWREARKACVDSPPKSKIFREVRDASLRAEVELEKAVDALSGGQAR